MTAAQLRHASQLALAALRECPHDVVAMDRILGQDVDPWTAEHALRGLEMGGQIVREPTTSPHSSHQWRLARPGE